MGYCLFISILATENICENCEGRVIALEEHHIVNISENRDLAPILSCMHVTARLGGRAVQQESYTVKRVCER